MADSYNMNVSPYLHSCGMFANISCLCYHILLRQKVRWIRIFRSGEPDQGCFLEFRTKLFRNDTVYQDAINDMNYRTFTYKLAVIILL